MNYSKHVKSRCGLIDPYVGYGIDHPPETPQGLVGWMCPISVDISASEPFSVRSDTQTYASIQVSQRLHCLKFSYVRNTAQTG